MLQQQQPLAVIALFGVLSNRRGVSPCAPSTHTLGLSGVEFARDPRMHIINHLAYARFLVVPPTALREGTSLRARIQRMKTATGTKFLE